MFNDLFNRTFLFGLGALTITKEKAEEMTEMLVNKGEMSRDEAQKVTNEFVEKGKKEKEALQDTVNSELNKVMNEANLANKEDIARLEAKIDELKELLESK